MRNFLSTVLAAGTLCAAGLAAAAPVTDADIARSAKHAEAGQRFFERIDTDHDGKISRAEYQAWIDGRFDRLDANHDGSIDAAEIAASPAAAERVQKRAERFVQRYATGDSGKVSKADFEAKEMARFDKLSAGADSLTAEQFTAGRRHAHHGARDDASAQ